MGKRRPTDRPNGSSAQHTKLVEDVLLAVGSLPYVRCWKNATGAARSFDNPDRIIRFGLTGSPDLVGFLNNGRFLGIECKTGNSSQSVEQINFEAMCRKFNSHYFLVRSVEEALSFVQTAAKGL